jgi:hypothetical protein
MAEHGERVRHPAMDTLQKTSSKREQIWSFSTSSMSHKQSALMANRTRTSSPWQNRFAQAWRGWATMNHVRSALVLTALLSELVTLTRVAQMTPR